MAEPVTVSGHCHALFSFEVGQSIDLNAAARIFRGDEPADPAQPPIGFGPASIRLAVAPLEIPGPGRAEAWLHEFGAATIVVSLPFDGPFEGAAPLGWSLRTTAVASMARERLREVVARISPAITRPRLAAVHEEYLVFALAVPASPADLPELVGGPMIAALLLGDAGPLAPEEIRRAGSARISYRPGDTVIVDWDAALVVQGDATEALSVLEFTNVQLLEFRHLDAELDRLAVTAYAALAAPTRSWLIPPRPQVAESRALGELQADAALLFERVSNQGKSMGDQYLARVYRLVAERFRLADWDRAIARKLDTIDGIYDKLSDRANVRRAELLEWLVILLIAAEVVLGLLRH